MIKTFEQYNEMDPYGEEDWNDVIFSAGDLLICKKRRAQYKGKESIVPGETYEIKDVINGAGTNFYIIAVPGGIPSVAFVREDKMKEYFDKK